MKNLLLTLLFPLLTFSQTQIGSDIDGEAANDLSGRVSLSSDGSILAIGAVGNDNFSGHVRVYENVNSVWTQIGNDIDGEAVNDFSGFDLSLSSDGSILAIGAPLNDDNGNSSGHVRIYENVNSVWTQIGNDIDGETAGDNFGISVSLSSNGSIVAIGAHKNNGNGNLSGSVSVYENINNVWTQIGNDIVGENEGDESGRRISLSSNGSIVAISASRNDANGDSSGHVRVYENVNSVWIQIGNDIDGENIADGNGPIAVSLSSDGYILAIGASSNDGNGNSSGHVRVYENISDVWTQIGNDIDGEAANDASGSNLSLSSDGNTLAIGATGNDGNGSSSGHVRIYRNISNVWTQIGNDIDGEATSDNFGVSVCLSFDSSIIAIGAESNDGNGLDSGHVRIYDLTTILSINKNDINVLKIYPNPVSQFLNIDIADSIKLEKVRIYDDLGRFVLEDYKTSINISKLLAGLYFLEVITNTGKATKKIIIE